MDLFHLAVLVDPVDLEDRLRQLNRLVLVVLVDQSHLVDLVVLAVQSHLVVLVVLEDLYHQ